MVSTKNVGTTIFNIFNSLIMVFLIFIALYPMVYILFASLSEPSQVLAHQGILLKPLGFTLESYKSVFKNQMIVSGYLNTIFIVSAGLVFNIVFTSIGAYFLSRKDVLYKNIIMFFIVFTMFFQGGLIPYYLTVKNIGLYNTHWAIIIPASINTFNLIIMRTSFLSIPDSLEESAKIDGAGHYTILFRIVMPLSLPVIAVMILYYGVGHWNAWFNAMVFLQDRKMFPLQLVVREILIQNNTQMMTMDAQSGDKESVVATFKYASIIITTVPILTLYPFLQKYFVKGVMIGALKG